MEQNCENCRWCVELWDGQYSDACTHPDADWEVETIRDEDGLIVRYEFDKTWDKLTSGQTCDLFEELQE